jgi:hypothetical protein
MTPRGIDGPPAGPFKAADEGKGWGGSAAILQSVARIVKAQRQTGGTSIADGIPRYVSFNLHQATETAYRCLLLTLALFSPKSRRIDILRPRAVSLAESLTEAWPRADRIALRASVSGLCRGGRFADL